MTPDNYENAEMVAEITVRRFFSHYLEEVFPEQLDRVVTAHNKDVTAHAPQIKAAVEVAAIKLKLWVIGLAVSGGAAAGAGLTKLLGG